MNLTLRAQLETKRETLSDLAWAAEQRYREGRCLKDAGYSAGAIYLLGLASEMWLKFACFRFSGATLGSHVADMLAPAKKWMKIHCGEVDAEGYHSLRFWAEYLLLRRVSEGRPLDRVLAGQLRHHVMNRLFGDWRIDLRYNAVVVEPRLAARVLGDTRWLRLAFGTLWR